MTARDIEIAQAELTDIISEKDDSKKGGKCWWRPRRLAYPRGSLANKTTDSVTRKRKIKRHNSDDEENGDDVYDGDHPREEVHKRVKIGDDAVIPKEKKGIQSVDTLETTCSNASTAW